MRPIFNYRYFPSLIVRYTGLSDNPLIKREKVLEEGGYYLYYFYPTLIWPFL